MERNRKELCIALDSVRPLGYFSTMLAIVLARLLSEP